MAASTRTFLIAGTALAVGIAGTVLVGTLRDRPGEMASPAPRSAWSDPVKAPAHVAAEATSRPPLRFEPDEEAKGVASVAAPTPLPPERPSALYAQADALPPDEAEAPVRRPAVREPRGEVRIVPSPARERIAEQPARAPKQRVSSAETGGVMQWLMERR